MQKIYKTAKKSMWCSTHALKFLFHLNDTGVNTLSIDRFKNNAESRETPAKCATITSRGIILATFEQISTFWLRKATMANSEIGIAATFLVYPMNARLRRN